MISDYFYGLFASQVYDTNPNLLEKVVPRITSEMYDVLKKTYSTEDVKKTLFSIDDMKTPGMDGLHALFFKKCWHIQDGDLIQEVLEAINNNIISDGWNDTVIVLIPKVESPESIMQ
jgi:hypothetical protein